MRRVDKVQVEHVQKAKCLHVWAACNPRFGSRIHVMPMDWKMNQALYIGIVAEFIHSIENDPTLPDEHKRNFIFQQDGCQCDDLDLNHPL